MGRGSSKIDNGRQQEAQMLFVVVPEEIQAGVTRREKVGLGVSTKPVPGCTEDMDREKFGSQVICTGVGRKR